MSASRTSRRHGDAGAGSTTVSESIPTPIFERVDEKNIDLSLPRFQKIRQQALFTFGFEIRQYQAGAVADMLDAQKDIFIIAGTGSG